MSDIREAGFGRATTAVTIVTTTEAVAVTSEIIKVTRRGMRALIFAFIEVDSGTATTAITGRIRAGKAITGTLISEAIAEETTAALAETWVVSAVDELGDVDEVSYSATIQQTAASANGTIDNATIIVLLF